MIKEYRSSVPKRRRPWLVNIVFRRDYDQMARGDLSIIEGLVSMALKGRAFDFERNGLSSTLMDLQRRKILRITFGESLRVQILLGVKAAEDDYERKVLKYFESHSINDLFDSAPFLQEIKDLGDKAFQDQRFKLFHTGVYLTNLFELQREVRDVRSAPKGDYGEYDQREKLEWDAFYNFLLDPVKIRDYASKDINIWWDWLIYGTALGVGENVLKAIDDMKIDMPEAMAVIYLPTHFGEIEDAIIREIMRSRRKYT